MGPSINDVTPRRGEGALAGVTMCDVGRRGLSVIVTSRKVHSAMPASPAGAGNGMTTLQLAS